MSFYIKNIKFRLGKFKPVYRNYGRWNFGLTIMDKGKMWIFRAFQYDLTIWYRG